MRIFAVLFASAGLWAQITLERHEVRTNGNGDFEIPGLPRGNYRPTATGEGFTTFIADRVLLESSEVRRVNVSFKIGSTGSNLESPLAA